MKKLVLLMALVSFAPHAFGGAPVCEKFFQKDTRAPDEFIRGNQEKFYEVTELEMTREEFNELRRLAQERANTKVESRVSTFQNKTARADGNTVTIEALIAGNKKTYQREFDISNANGNFEQTTGQYWIMPHNQGRLLVWNYTKNRVYDVKLPESTILVDVSFDLTTNIYQPRMLIEYRKHADHSEMVDVLHIEIDLVTGKEL